MNFLNKLQSLRTLLSDPSNWTQGCYARDKNERVVAWSDPNAIKFCAMGATWKVGFNQQERSRLYDLFPNLVFTNDCEGREEVIKGLTSIIKSMTRKETKHLVCV